MYERFTDRARRVMALANQEAQRFNHEYIGPEHVLLGLIKEGSGVGANVLKNFDVDLRVVRTEVEKLVRPGADLSCVKLLRNPQINEVIQSAIDYTKLWNHNYVGTEHLLAGLLRGEDYISSRILENLGVTAKEIISELESLLGVGEQSFSEIPTTERNYWIVPKKDLGLAGLLRAVGYEAAPDSDEKSLHLLSPNNKEVLSLPYSGNGSLGTPTIHYQHTDLETGQVEDALRAREILDLNKIRYDEKPPRQEVAQALRSRNEIILADRVEGK